MEELEFNVCCDTDSYKLTHWLMFPDKTKQNYSYFEARIGATFNETVWFGLQYILKKYFSGNIVTREKIEEANELVAEHIGKGIFNREGWEYILDKYEGRLPIEIKAVPEGTSVPVGNVMMTINNTDPNTAWLTNVLETMLMHVYYGSTVATLSREIKIMLKDYALKTCTNLNILDFQLHDFGFRGVSSYESAIIGGAAHLINFKGTDTVPALRFIKKYYYNGVCGYSVPASEHSVMTAYAETGEMKVFAHLLKQFPKGILSVVIDSYNYMNFVKMAGEVFKDEILKREGKVVFRPDSGTPDAVTLDVISELEKYFGAAQNPKGFYELNPKVGVLWGDGIDYAGIKSILFSMRNCGYASSNIVFGMGGGLLQKVNRDTQRCAIKLSAQEREDGWHDVYKTPVEKSKSSKKGCLALIQYNEHKFKTVSWNPNTETETKNNILRTVFKDGRIISPITFNEIKQNAAI